MRHTSQEESILPHWGVRQSLFPRFQVVRAMHSGAFPRGDGSQYEVYSFGGDGK